MYRKAVKCRLVLASEINAFFMFSVIGKLPNRLEKKQIFMISDGVFSKIVVNLRSPCVCAYFI